MERFPDEPRDGRVFRPLNIIDEDTKEALMIRTGRKLNSVDGIDALTDLFFLCSPQEFIRSDDRPFKLRARRSATHC